MSAPMDAVSAPPRRSAMWPWLVMPIAALSLFFALRSVRDHTVAPPVQASPAPTVHADG